jgi:hypothetical protein
MMPRKTSGTREQPLQPAQQRQTDVTADRIPAPAINCRKNFGSERTREDWSARLLELMLSR